MFTSLTSKDLEVLIMYSNDSLLGQKLRVTMVDDRDTRVSPKIWYTL